MRWVSDMLGGAMDRAYLLIFVALIVACGDKPAPAPAPAPAPSGPATPPKIPGNGGLWADALLFPPDSEGLEASGHPIFRTASRGYQRVQVLVRDNNVDQALKALKKKMQREGIFREMKLRGHYEKPSEKKAREKARVSGFEPRGTGSLFSAR